MGALSRTPNLWLAGCLAIVLVGCQPAAPASSPSGTTPAPTASGLSTPASSPGPDASPVLPDLVLAPDPVDLVEPCPFEFDTCELEAGSYTSSRFIPRLNVALDEGWALRFHTVDVLDFLLPGARGGLTIQRGPRLAADQPPLRDIEAVQQRLGEFSDLEVSEPQPTTLWGLPAVRLDVVAGGDVENAFITGMRSTEHDQVVWLLPRGSKTRFVNTVVEGELVMVSYGTFTVEAFDGVAATAERVLEVSRLAEP